MIQNKLTEPVCKIIHRNGQSLLTDENGRILPKQIFCRVTQKLNEPAYAIVQVIVDLTDTK